MVLVLLKISSTTAYNQVTWTPMLSLDGQAKLSPLFRHHASASCGCGMPWNQIVFADIYLRHILILFCVENWCIHIAFNLTQIWFSPYILIVVIVVLCLLWCSHFNVCLMLLLQIHLLPLMQRFTCLYMVFSIFPFFLLC